MKTQLGKSAIIAGSLRLKLTTGSDYFVQSYKDGMLIRNKVSINPDLGIICGDDAEDFNLVMLVLTSPSYFVREDCLCFFPYESIDEKSVETYVTLQIEGVTDYSKVDVQDLLATLEDYWKDVFKAYKVGYENGTKEMNARLSLRAGMQFYPMQEASGGLSFASVEKDVLDSSEEVELKPLPTEDFINYLCGHEVLEVFDQVGCDDIEEYGAYLCKTYKIHHLVMTLILDRYVRAGKLDLLEQAIKDGLEGLQKVSDKIQDKNNSNL